jgi:hypothetical protein
MVLFRPRAEAPKAVFFAGRFHTPKLENRPQKNGGKGWIDQILHWIDQICGLICAFESQFNKKLSEFGLLINSQVS